MLKKLLKYDLNYIYKSQIILYGITVICLIIAKLFQTLDQDFFIYYSIKLSFLIFTYAMIFVLIINNLTKLWSRFNSAVYGEESYLIHTLPVTKDDIYLSKTIASIIALSTSTLFVFIVDLIVRDFKPREIMVYIGSEHEIISQYLENLQIQTMMGFMLLIVLITLSLIGYFSLILGYKGNKNKLFNSIIIGVSLFVLTFVSNFIFYFIIGIFNKGVSNFLWHATLYNNSEKVIVIITTIFFIVASIVYYLLGLKNLKKGIDIE